MTADLVLVSRTGDMPASLRSVMLERGLVVPSLESLLDVGWERKPETLFYDLRSESLDSISRSLQVISANFSQSCLVVLHDCGLSLEAAALLLQQQVDGEWDLRTQSVPDAAWLRPAPVLRQSLFRVQAGTQTLCTWHQSVYQMLQTASRLSDSRVPILLSGETGTGKSTIAQSIHRWSGRADKPFLFFPCGAVSRDLIHAELFGHTRGAFTGATHERPGKIEAAGQGTLLIDEVDLLTLDDQAKLLRVVETGQFERVGTVETSLSRCRLIFASNVDLQSQVQAGRFRSDLYFRINVLELQLLPLRERRRDIPLIAVDCLRSLLPEHGITHVNVTLRMLHALAEYHWPGNIRELRNRLLRGLTLCEGSEIQLQQLGLPKSDGGAVLSGSGLGRQGQSLTGQVAEASREAIVTCIRAHGNRKAAAARALKISRSTLYRKMREYGIQEQELGAEVSTT